MARPQRVAILAIRRLGWGVADQAVSSLTNFAASIYVVRTLGPTQFGAFGLAYVTYGFALNASRGLSTDPLMVRFSGTSIRKWRNATANCTGNALVVGLATGLCALGAAMVLTGAARGAFLALGLTLPGLTLQDSWRFSFFAAGRGWHAFLNDTIWALTLVPALVLLRVSGHANVFAFTFAWGATGGIAAVAGMFQANVVPRPARAWEWLTRHGDLGTRYLLEGTSNSVVVQVRTYGTGAMLGLATVGYVQASVTLMGPMTILSLGMGLVTISEGARVLRQSPRKLPLFCLLVSAGLSLAGVVWGLALLIAVPRGLGSFLLHSNWRPVYPLVLPQILFIVGGAVGSGAGTGLHALGAARRSLRVVLLIAPLSAGFALAGAAVAGAAGSLYGVGIASWLGALMLWVEFWKAWRERDRIPIGHLKRSRGRHRRRG